MAVRTIAPPMRAPTAPPTIALLEVAATGLVAGCMVGASCMVMLTIVELEGPKMIREVLRVSVEGTKTVVGVAGVSLPACVEVIMGPELASLVVEIDTFSIVVSGSSDDAC